MNRPNRKSKDKNRPQAQSNRDQNNSNDNRGNQKRRGNPNRSNKSRNPQNSDRSGNNRGPNRNSNRSGNAPGSGGNRRNRKKPNREGQDQGRVSGPGKSKTPSPPKKPYVHIKKNYGVLFYDTFIDAKNDREKIQSQQESLDQLNIVIRADGNMDDPELNALGKIKLFAGTAWALVHDRRVEDGWYNEPR